MFHFISKSYEKVIIKMIQQFNKTILKAAVFTGLAAYWAIIIIGTFFQIN